MSNKDTSEIVQDGIDESAGSETLKPNPTRAEMLATFSSLLAQLKGEDLSHFFNDSIKQYSADGVPSATAPGGAPVAAPSDAIILFNGKDLSKWSNQKWKIVGDVAIFRVIA